MARPLRSSLAEHIQILGRGLRVDAGDPSKECVVLDHAGNCVRFWDAMNEFFTHGPVALDDGKVKPKKAAANVGEDKVRKCPSCHAVHSPRPTCPACGFEYPRKRRAHMPGELAELGPGARAPREVKEAILGQLIYYQLERGYKAGWVAHKFRERFGVFPNYISADPVPTSPEIRRWIRSRQIAFAKAAK
jgi:hypothetical protein